MLFCFVFNGALAKSFFQLAVNLSPTVTQWHGVIGISLRIDFILIYIKSKKVNFSVDIFFSFMVIKSVFIINIVSENISLYW